MRFLTPQQWQDWCVERGVPLQNCGWIRPALDVGVFHSAKYPVPTDSGGKICLARQLVKFVASDRETLLLLDDWAVWPSSQHLPLFTRFREAVGENRSLIEAPGQLVDAAETDDAVSIVAMSLLFFWDCYGISATGGEAFYISHDEHYRLFGPEPAVVSRVAEELQM
jgi:hypothetical protein